MARPVARSSLRHRLRRAVGSDLRPGGVRRVVNSDTSLIAFGAGVGSTTTVADVATGAVVEQLEGGGGSIFDVAFSPDGTRIASAGADARAWIWDVATGDLQDTITANQGGIEMIDWSADGTRLATASDDGHARVFDVGSGAGRELVSVSDTGTAHGIQSVVFSPDGNRIMTGELNMTAVKIWDVSPEAGPEWLSVAAAGPSVGGGFLDDGRAVAASDGNGRVGVWDIASGAHKHEFAVGGLPEEGDSGTALGAAGSVIAVFGRPSYPVVAWDTKTTAVVRLFGIRRRPGDGHGVVSGRTTARDRRLTELRWADHDPGPIGNLVTRLYATAGEYLDTVTLSPDGKRLLAHRFGTTSGRLADVGFPGPDRQSTNCQDLRR